MFSMMTMMMLLFYEPEPFGYSESLRRLFSQQHLKLSLEIPFSPLAFLETNNSDEFVMRRINLSFKSEARYRKGLAKMK